MARACAGWQARRYGWDVPPAWITPLADVVAGLQAAIEQFTPPGTPGRPAHARPTCRSWPSRARWAGELIEVPMVERDGRHDLRPRRHRRRRSTRGARLLVHVNPHNPLGRVFDVEEQLALADVVDGRRRPGLLRRDPRAAGPPRRRAPALRLAVPGDGAAHRHRDVGVQGLERAGPQGGPADPVQRRRTSSTGRGSAFLYAPRRLHARACWPRPPPTTRAAAWLDGVLALPRRQPAAARRPARRAAARRSGTPRRRAPTWPGWTAGGSELAGLGRRLLPRAGGRRAGRRAGVRGARAPGTCG